MASTNHQLLRERFIMTSPQRFTAKSASQFTSQLWCGFDQVYSQVLYHLEHHSSSSYSNSKHMALASYMHVGMPLRTLSFTTKTTFITIHTCSNTPVMTCAHTPSHDARCKAAIPAVLIAAPCLLSSQHAVHTTVTLPALLQQLFLVLPTTTVHLYNICRSAPNLQM